MSNFNGDALSSDDPYNPEDCLHPYELNQSCELVNKLILSIHKELETLKVYLDKYPHCRPKVKHNLNLLSTSLQYLSRHDSVKEISNDSIFAIKSRKLLPNRYDKTNHEERCTDYSEPNLWSGFYNKTLRERQDLLSLVYPNMFQTFNNKETAKKHQHCPSPENIGELPQKIANLMIENCIGVLGLPLGLALNFVIDGKSLAVPMSVEEPSVLAAASSAAKLISTLSDGFHTYSSGNIMTAQIQYTHIEDIQFTIKTIEQHKQDLISFINTNICPNMVKRGGGALDILIRTFPEVSMLVLHVDVDVCEAMGANSLNTIAEAVALKISPLIKGKCGLRILTNLCIQRRSKSMFRVPVEKLGWKGMDGTTVAKRILGAYDFALTDTFRACTHNKGIMNGIDAVAVATGQDWRAIEAAAHTYASRKGMYQSLSHYKLVEDPKKGLCLEGSLEIPLSVGTKGGALQTHPGYSLTLALLDQPTAIQLSSILVSVGLAQNFAALRALAVTGIQQGHMALHARNIAAAAGTPSELVAEVCAYMQSRGSINTETASSYLAAQTVYKQLYEFPLPSTTSKQLVAPSMLYVELSVPNSIEDITINIAFESLGTSSDHLVIVHRDKDIPLPQLQIDLLGNKGFTEIYQMFTLFDQMKLELIPSKKIEGEAHLGRANVVLQNKLKLISILLNVLAYRLSSSCPNVTTIIVEQMLKQDTISGFSHVKKEKILEHVDVENPMQRAGFPLLVSLWHVFQYVVEQEVFHQVLGHAIVEEQKKLLSVLSKPSKSSSFQKDSAIKSDLVSVHLQSFLSYHTKRWQATMFLLIDALGFNSDILTQGRVDFLSKLGSYLEWEGMIAHDIARLSRALHDQKYSEANAVLLWIELITDQKCKSYEKAEQLLPLFNQYVEQYSSSLWSSIWKEKDGEVARVFDLNGIASIVDVIKRHYSPDKKK